jgi:uncharacterized RDD family membrane protein YckC
MRRERVRQEAPTSVVISAMAGVVLLGVPLAFVGWYVVAIGSMAFAGCSSRPSNCNYALGDWTLRGYPFLAGLLVLAFVASIWLLRDRTSTLRIVGLAVAALLTLGALIATAAALVTYAAAV